MPDDISFICEKIKERIINDKREQKEKQSEKQCSSCGALFTKYSNSCSYCGNERKKTNTCRA